MDTCKTRKRLALAITAALLLPGMAVAQTAKERELETRIAQLEAQVQALLAAQQQQQASIVQTQTTLDAVRVAQTAPSDGKPKSQPSPILTAGNPDGRFSFGGFIKLDAMVTVAAVFIAQYAGIDLSLSQYLIIALASVLGSFGTAGVPGTAVIMATVVLSAAGLPLETIGYLYAIDRILDMMRTMTNVTGQILVPTLVAKETGMLDRGIYEAANSDVGLDEGEQA